MRRRAMGLSFRWADVSEDKYARATLAFLHRKQRLGTMLKILKKLISTTSKVGLLVLHLFRRIPEVYHFCARLPVSPTTLPSIRYSEMGIKYVWLIEQRLAQSVSYADRAGKALGVHE